MHLTLYKYIIWFQSNYSIEYKPWSWEVYIKKFINGKWCELVMFYLIMVEFLGDSPKKTRKVMKKKVYWNRGTKQWVVDKCGKMWCLVDGMLSWIFIQSFLHALGKHEFSNRTIICPTPVLEAWKKGPVLEAVVTNWALWEWTGKCW